MAKRDVDKSTLEDDAPVRRWRRIFRLLLLVTLLTPPPTLSASWQRRSVANDGQSNVHQCPPVSDQSNLNSFLWTIQRTEASIPSYMFGTIHVPYTRVWDYVPINAKLAFQRANSVHFELDLLDQATVVALNACQLLPRGQSLVDVLPPDIYQRLRRHLNYVRRNMPGWMASAAGRQATGSAGPGGADGPALYAAEYMFDAIAGNWERKRPVYILLMVNSLTESDVRARGTPVLDMYLAQEASRAGKQRAAVELVEEHCLPLNSMNLSQVLFALNYTLTQYEAQRAAGNSSPTHQLVSVDDGLAPLYTADDLVYEYNCGDLDSTLFAAAAPATTDGYDVTSAVAPPKDVAVSRQINDYFRSELIDKRNRRMAMRIDRLLVDRPYTSFFFALGAGHFLGNGSLIELLRQRGYIIRHVLAGEPLPDIQVNSSWRQHYPDTHRQMKPADDGVAETSVSRSLSAFSRTEHGGQQRPASARRRHRVQVDRRKSGRRHLTSSLPSTRVTSRPQFKDLWVRLDTLSSDVGPEVQLTLWESDHSPRVSIAITGRPSGRSSSVVVTSNYCFHLLLLTVYLTVRLLYST